MSLVRKIINSPLVPKLHGAYKYLNFYNVLLYYNFNKNINTVKYLYYIEFYFKS